MSLMATGALGNVAALAGGGTGGLGGIPSLFASFLPPGWSGPFVWDPSSALHIPSVARAVQLYGGMCKQMSIDVYRGPNVLDRTRLLDRPDPVQARSWFVQVSVEDYLLAGNALSLITGRNAEGWPSSVSWLPAEWVYVAADADRGPEYYLLGERLPTDDVIHVRRGADRHFPVRGVGVVEQHLGSLDRVALEEEYERSSLSGGAVPSVAVVVPNANISQQEAEEAKDRWMTVLAGPGREPVFLPNGTEVKPLGWSPTDAQLGEARKMSLTDVANIFNLDGYWLGAPISGLTYRTAAPLYQSLLRTSIEPILADFEDVWSAAWLPRNQYIRFDRNQVLREDLPTTVDAVVKLVAAGIITVEEARRILSLPIATNQEPMAPQLTGAQAGGSNGQNP